MRGSGQARTALETALTAQRPLSISPALRRLRLVPRRLMVRLRTLTPSIEVRILAGHPLFERALASNARRACPARANAKLFRRGRAARRRFPHLRPLGRAGAELCHSNGLAAGLFRLLPPA